MFIYLSLLNELITKQTQRLIFHINYVLEWFLGDRLCSLVVRVLGYRYGGPGSIPGTTRIKKSSGSGTGSIQPREYN
jgi:hypothetical protein